MTSSSIKCTVVFAALIGLPLHSSPASAGTPVDSSYPDMTLARLSAQIRSKADLAAYLHRTPVAKSPLRFLAAEPRHDFLSKLVYDDTGVVSFSYAELAGLTVTQAYQILALFGEEATVPGIGGLKVSTPLDQKIRMKTPPPGGEYNAIHYPNPPFQCIYAKNLYCNYSG